MKIIAPISLVALVAGCSGGSSDLNAVGGPGNASVEPITQLSLSAGAESTENAEFIFTVVTPFIEGDNGPFSRGEVINVTPQDVSFDFDAETGVTTVNSTLDLDGNGTTDTQSVTFTTAELVRNTTAEGVNVYRLIDDTNDTGLGEVAYLIVGEEAYSGTFRLDVNGENATDPVIYQSFAVSGVVEDRETFDVPTGNATFSGTVHIMAEQSGNFDASGYTQSSELLFGDATAQVALGPNGSGAGSMEIVVSSSIDTETGIATELGNIVYDLPDGFTPGGGEAITSGSITYNGRTYSDLESTGLETILGGRTANEAALTLQAAGSNSDTATGLVDNLNLVGAGVLVRD